MNANVLTPSKFNLLQKQFLPSRIACAVFTAFLLSYVIGGVGVAGTIIGSVLMVLFVTQFLLQYQLLNAILGGTMLLVGFYFAMAVWSEFSEFEVITREAKLLLTLGWSGCLAVIVFGFLMVRSALFSD